MKLRTIRMAVCEIRKLDPETALTETFLKRLIQNGVISYSKCGRRALLEMHTLKRELAELFGIEDSVLPTLRTIRNAAKSICCSDRGNAMTEYRIRMLIRNGQLPHYNVGTRQIIAMEAFENQALFAVSLRQCGIPRSNLSQSVCLSKQFDSVLSETTQTYVCRRKRRPIKS